MSEAKAITLELKVVKTENFAKKNLNGSSFIECTFESCDFSESMLQNAKFYLCTFVNCNLSLTKLGGCRFQDVKFIACKIVGGEFFKCDKVFFSASFKNCIMQYCNFSDLNMKRASFSGSRLKDGHFTNTVLVETDFDGVDLAGTIFHNCDLSKADFSKASQYNIDPQTNKIKGAKFSLPEAMGLLRGFEITIV